MSAARPLVKVCGIRTLEDLASAEGADLIGVVIEVPDSPRTRSLSEARSLFERAEGRFQRVAVMVGADAEKVRQVLRVAAPDLVQLHGPVPSGLSAGERRRIVPSLPVARPGQVGAAPPTLPDGADDFPFLHLDTAGGKLPGGTGQRSDWAVARDLVRAHPSRRFLLGGGLTPENVSAALAEVRPAGVDVSSGVEARPGIKSRDKVERLLLAVRRSADPL